jgi:predicted kinase
MAFLAAIRFQSPISRRCVTMTGIATIHLIAGPTGAGKTTLARRLAEEIGGVQFSIDDWMARLFWMDSPQPIQFEWTMERINRCEALITDMAVSCVQTGTPVVLDLGFTESAHRAKFADVARGAGAALVIHEISGSADERWTRVQQRNAEKGETYALAVTREMFDFMEERWQPVSDGEATRVQRHGLFS